MADLPCCFCLGRIVSHLEKGTLKLLAENDRIASFSPDLHERFMAAYESCTAKVKLRGGSYSGRMM